MSEKHEVGDTGIICDECHIGPAMQWTGNNKCYECAMGMPLKQIVDVDTGKVRQFATGATRDTDEGKPDYIGFTSALVTKRFGEYMMRHQKQSDGQLRSSSNWRKGIPKEAYLSSLRRHLEDVTLIMEGHPDEAREPMEDALCAVLFNAQGLLYEVLKDKKKAFTKVQRWQDGLEKAQTSHQQLTFDPKFKS